ncbi:hypothetical protein B551_0222535 [Cupriavidus sp. HPC(L)]|uniref:hypothetical protein n=1 Tax=Cupriavidus sp. HPC(L) TaxID=1217418 RepID=UPI0002919CAC|nr:hypothetical protein [Cupriavidus sp. HPC(L)]ESH90751.1 hypothetical protein B551_0222535 [Cupriavidus sp. HPC(L)]
MKVKRLRELAQQRNRLVTEKLRITPDWVPSARNLKALPRPLRDYIHRLHAFDPQHYVQKVAMLQDHIRMVEADNKRLRQTVEWNREDAERYRIFCAAGWPVCFLGTEYQDKSALDAAIDAVTKTNKENT